MNIYEKDIAKMLQFHNSIMTKQRTEKIRQRKLDLDKEKEERDLGETFDFESHKSFEDTDIKREDIYKKGGDESLVALKNNANIVLK